MLLLIKIFSFNHTLQCKLRMREIYSGFPSDFLNSLSLMIQHSVLVETCSLKNTSIIFVERVFLVGLVIIKSMMTKNC